MRTPLGFRRAARCPERATAVNAAGRVICRHQSLACELSG